MLGMWVNGFFCGMELVFSFERSVEVLEILLLDDLMFGDGDLNGVWEGFGWDVLEVRDGMVSNLLLVLFGEKWDGMVLVWVWCVEGSFCGVGSCVKLGKLLVGDLGMFLWRGVELLLVGGLF